MLFRSSPFGALLVFWVLAVGGVRVVPRLRALVPIPSSRFRSSPIVLVCCGARRGFTTSQQRRALRRTRAFHAGHMFAQRAARSKDSSALSMYALHENAGVCLLRSQQGMCVGVGDAMPRVWRRCQALAQRAPRWKRWGGWVGAFCVRHRSPHGCSQAQGLLT